MKTDVMVKAGKYLKQYFGHSEFREEQKEVLKEIFKGKDMLVVMPTGKGKSLCYQLPSVMARGTGIVISPLIALMKDQVDKMTDRGIKAAFLNSSLNKTERRNIVEQLKNNKFKLLYIAPEKNLQQRFLKDSFRN